MTVLYRTYRPQKFSDLVGQEAIASTLLAQLESGKFSHAYLFYGPKGTGKTSTARILAKAVNCQGLASSELAHSGLSPSGSKTSSKKRSDNLTTKFGEPCNKCDSCLAISQGSHLDVLEIDAASNRGIDEIRDLREKIKLSPISGRFKVYIIDEVHMLTAEAFNALLKTLEEPPAHAIFILCTTELGKLPPTVVSRLQKFHFERAASDDLVKVLEKIAKSENVKMKKEAAAAIAQIADGSYRDAVSIFDQLSSKGAIVLDDVLRIAGIGGWNQLYEFVQCLAYKKLKEAVLAIEKISEDGLDISYFTKSAILFLEKLLFIKIGIINENVENYSHDQVEKMKKLSAILDILTLQNLMKIFLVAESDMKLYPLPQISLILAICKYMPQSEKRNDELKNAESVHENAKNSSNDSAVISKADIDQKVKETKRMNNDEVVFQTKNGNGNSASLKKIEKDWEKFLQKVKSVNVHVLALLRSSRPIDFDGVYLTLEVFYRFHKEKLEEPKIVTMLDNFMQEIISKPIKLKFVLAKKDKVPPSVVAESNVIDIEGKDIAKMAQEIFSK